MANVQFLFFMGGWETWELSSGKKGRHYRKTLDAIFNVQRGGTTAKLWMRFWMYKGRYYQFGIRFWMYEGLYYRDFLDSVLGVLRASLF